MAVRFCGLSSVNISRSIFQLYLGSHVGKTLLQFYFYLLLCYLVCGWCCINNIKNLLFCKQDNNTHQVSPVGRTQSDLVFSSKLFLYTSYSRDTDLNVSTHLAHSTLFHILRGLKNIHSCLSALLSGLSQHGAMGAWKRRSINEALPPITSPETKPGRSCS